MSQDLKHTRGPGMTVLLIAVSCLVFSCASIPPAARRSTAPLPAGSANNTQAGEAPSAVQAKPGNSGAAGSTGSASSVASKTPRVASATDEKREGKQEATPSPATHDVTPQAQGKPQAPPLPEPSPAQISRQISAFGSAGSWPLSSEAGAIYVKRRPSATAGVDVFAIFVAVAHASDAEVAAFSDFSRLFKQAVSPVAFSLVEFHESGKRLVHIRSFPLGNHLVFESFKIIPIKKGSDQPFAVSVTFQTQEGSDNVWETFSALGNSQIVLQQTLSRSPLVEDIDNDGYLDIILRERGIEEGTGYETFLTWYKWNGKSFVEYKTTNIVRNLREFLDRAARLLSENRISDFLHSSIRSEELSRLRSEGKSEGAILDEVFRLIPSSPDNPNDPIAQLNSIQRVIFPNIFENPFTEQSRHGYRFPLTVRFVTTDGSSHFYSASVYMHRNPFVAPEFTFAVNSSNEPR